MNFGSSNNWFGEKISNYNLFIPDDDDYEDGNNASKDTATVISHQRYATRLYVGLMITILYLLFFITFANEKPQIITVSNITPFLFNQLRLEHGTTLSCPCSTTTVTYNVFVTNTISLHPVCSSVFVSQEWIEALYWPNASAFLVMDFRTTANSQFQLLAYLCQLCQRTIANTQDELENNQIVTVELLSENEVQSQINESIGLARTSAPVQVTLLIQFLRIATRSNVLISALNTNAVIKMYFFWTYYIEYAYLSTYIDENAVSLSYEFSTCDIINSTTPAGFYSMSYDQNANNHMYWPRNPYGYEANVSAMVAGFFGGCTPLDALLASTLECLHNIDCLGLLDGYFPGLREIDLDWNRPLPSSRQQNIALNDRLNNLLIEEWSTFIDYLKYFNKCAPKACSYTTKKQTNYFYTISLIISLYGGLAIILRLISMSLVNISYELKQRLLNVNLNKIFNVASIQRFGLRVKQLNLFKSGNRRMLGDIKQQRVTTRLYLILLAGSILILLVSSWFDQHTTTITVAEPSLATYQRMQQLYTNTLECSCSNVSVSYSTFTSLHPTLHQVCSSDFVSDAWLSMATLFSTTQWRGLDGRHFRLLAAFCQLVNGTIDNALLRFNTRYLVTLNVLSEPNFKEELDAIFEQFIQALTINFNLQIAAIRLFTRVDQPFTITNQYVFPPPLAFTIPTVQGDQPSLPKLSFRWNSISNALNSSTECLCATNPQCQSPAFFSSMQNISVDGIDLTQSVKVLGVTEGCFMLDSLMLSTLECLYSNSCLTILKYYVNLSSIAFQKTFGVTQIDLRPLVYEPTSSIFPSNTSLQTIMEEMMVEQWNPSFSFDRYYEGCAPTYCQYVQTTRTTTFGNIVVTLISTISGLTVLLRLIIPCCVKFIFYLLQPKVAGQLPVHPNLCVRLGQMLRRLIMLLSKKVDHLSIFHRRHFGSDIDLRRSKRLGRLATRLYIILLITGLTIFILHAIIQPEVLTKTIARPSLSIYNRLLLDHNQTLQCPCSSVSSIYDTFITIEPLFHQICSSPFASDEWRVNVTAGLASDLSVYDEKDYRRFLSAHTQFLIGLCDLSMHSVHDSVNEFLSSLLITTQLLPPTTFRTRIDSLVSQHKSTTPVALDQLIFSIRSTNQGNAIVSTYGTNFRYDLLDWYINEADPAYPVLGSLALTKAMTYDNECSCGLNASCTTDAVFVDAHSSNDIPLKGFKMGCTPSESFFASTLECFYDLSCISLIQKQSNSTDNGSPAYLTPLRLTNSSQFSMNATIIQLVNDLFIENWSTTINYSAYFNQCSPASCSYTYLQELNSLYTVTLLLGLYGGFNIALKWICPKIVHLINVLQRSRKKRSNLVQSVHSIEKTAVQTDNPVPNLINTDSATVQFVRARSLSSTLQSVLVGVFVLILVTAGFIGPWIYLNQQTKKDDRTAISSTSMTTDKIPNTIIPATMISPTTISPCQLSFHTITAYAITSNALPESAVIADFNGDGHPDITVPNGGTDNIGILISNGNGTFQALRTFSTIIGSEPVAIAVADFNRDDRLDLAVANWNASNVGILLGKGDGTFEEQMTFSTGSQSHPTSVVAGYFNSDDQLDLAVANDGTNSVSILLGYGNGSFGAQTSFLTVGSAQLVASDFNNDGQLDLAVACYYDDDSFRVLLGNGNGTFSTPIRIATGLYSRPASIAVGDFNSDNRSDIAVGNADTSSVDIFLGNGDGTFQNQTKYFAGTAAQPKSIAVGDFNSDNQTDLAVGDQFTSRITILLGIGNGSFLRSKLLSVGSSIGARFVTGGDLDNDGRLDLVVVDSTTGNVNILLNSGDCYAS